MATCNEIHIIKDEARWMMKMTASSNTDCERKFENCSDNDNLYLYDGHHNYASWTLLSLTQ